MSNKSYQTPLVVKEVYLPANAFFEVNEFATYKEKTGIDLEEVFGKRNENGLVNYLKQEKNRIFKTYLVFEKYSVTSTIEVELNGVYPAYVYITDDGVQMILTCIIAVLAGNNFSNAERLIAHIVLEDDTSISAKFDIYQF